MEASLHVVIMGCGRVGSILANSLERGGHSVSIIDMNPDSFRRLGHDFHGDTITGVGFDRKVLIDAGIERADAFAAVSSGDNSNIISARVAKETFGVRRVVARIYDWKRAEVFERLGITTVATVRWSADRMMRRIVPEDYNETWRDSTTMVAMIEVPVHPDWTGKPVHALEEATGARVAYLVRFGAGKLPTRSMLLQDGDRIYMLVTDEISGQVMKIAGHPPEAVR